MRLIKIVITFSLVLFSNSVFSQNSFVEKLQTRKAGEGEVTIHHDAKINALLGSDNKSFSGTTHNGNTNVNQDGQNVSSEHKSIKAKGFRIQVYAGNNSRVARNEALNVAAKVREQFPDIPVYTYFQPPRWLCRVGDFRSIEEADVTMRRIRATGNFKEVAIVKEQINVPID